MFDFMTKGDIWKWIWARLKERTTHDGAAIIVLVLIWWFASPLIDIASYAAVAYGLWRMVQKDKDAEA